MKAVLPISILLTTACGHLGAGRDWVISEQLPMKRVVLYNGISYFEQEGESHGDMLWALGQVG